jgi:hypothetical protein
LKNISKILLAKVFSRDYLPRYIKSCAQQREFKEVWDRFDQLIVTDDQSCAFKAKRILGFENFQSVVAPLQTEGVFNLSKGKNLALDFAAKNDYDYVFVVDVDVSVCYYPTILPQNNQYLVGKWVNTPKILKEAPKPEEFCGCSMFLFSRKTIENFRYDERFFGHGWDDCEFVFTTLFPNGILPIEDNLCIHTSHGINPLYMLRGHDNKELFYQKLKKCYTDKNLGLPDHGLLNWLKKDFQNWLTNLKNSV